MQAQTDFEKEGQVLKATADALKQVHVRISTHKILLNAEHIPAPHTATAAISSTSPLVDLLAAATGHPEGITINALTQSKKTSLAGAGRSIKLSKQYTWGSCDKGPSPKKFTHKDPSSKKRKPATKPVTKAAAKMGRQTKPTMKKKAMERDESDYNESDNEQSDDG